MPWRYLHRDEHSIGHTQNLSWSLQCFTEIGAYAFNRNFSLKDGRLRQSYDMIKYIPYIHLPHCQTMTRR